MFIPILFSSRNIMPYLCLRWSILIIIDSTITDVLIRTPDGRAKVARDWFHWSSYHSLSTDRGLLSCWRQVNVYVPVLNWKTFTLRDGVTTYTYIQYSTYRWAEYRRCFYEFLRIDRVLSKRVIIIRDTTS